MVLVGKTTFIIFALGNGSAISDLQARVWVLCVEAKDVMYVLYVSKVLGVLLQKRDDKKQAGNCLLRFACCTLVITRGRKRS